MRLVALLIFSWAVNFLSAQNSLSGIVKDASGQPISFVSVLLNGSPTNGLLTDIDGKFSIKLETKSVDSIFKIRSLTFRCVGFETQKLELASLKTNTKTIEIILKSIEGELGEVVIHAGENPAHRIIKLAVEHRNENNPERMDGFACRTYNKMCFDFLPDSLSFSKKMAHRDPEKKSSKRRAENFLKLMTQSDSTHAWLMETVTDLKFKFPDRRQERVVLNQVAGFQESYFVQVSNQIQPFSFYQDYLNIFSVDFLNPISPNSISQYHFIMEDTLYQGNDTVWVIRFWPRKGKAFEGLKGNFLINSNNYAIQTLHVEPDNQKLISISLDQQYKFVKDSISGKSHWFPDMMNFDLVMENYPSKELGLMVSGRSYLDSIRISPTFLSRDFDPKNPFTFDKDATVRNEKSWASVRLRPLDSKDLHTYQRMDSIGRNHHFDRLTMLSELSSTGVLPLRRFEPFGLDILNLLRINEFEFLRPGYGLTTASPHALIPRRSPFEWNGWTGYGLRDQTWKFGSAVRVRLNRTNETYFSLDARRDLTEPGSFDGFSGAGGVVNRRFYASQMDEIRQVTASLGSRLSQKLGLYGQVKMSSTLDLPRYNYVFIEPQNDSLHHFQLTEISGYLRFALFKNQQKVFGIKLSETSRLPIIEIGFTRGLNNFLNGQFAFQRWEMSISQSINVRKLGKLRYRIEGGLISGNAPLTKLFTINQSGTGAFALFSIDNAFQTIDTLLLSDRSISVFFKQELGAPFWKKSYSKPFISFIQNASFGDLSKPELHSGLAFVTPKKGLFESGLVLDDLVRIKLMNLVRLGGGVASFYRWGDLSSADWKQNFTFRFSLSLSL